MGPLQWDSKVHGQWNHTVQKASLLARNHGTYPRPAKNELGSNFRTGWTPSAEQWRNGDGLIVPPSGLCAQRAQRISLHHWSL